MNKSLPLAIALSCILNLQGYSRQNADRMKGGISFEQELNWVQILEKAKKENKLVFLAIHTSWCVTCKTMEKQVYHQESVGSFFNRHFISAKVQMDKTTNDPPSVRRWYEDASFLEKEYSIDQYPTYLFLTADGKPLHRYAGALSEKNFLGLAHNALQPDQQSYTLYEKYDPHKMDTGIMKQTARSLRRTNPELAESIAISYLGKLPVTFLGLSDNLKLISEFSYGTRMRGMAISYITGLPRKEWLLKEHIRLMLKLMQDIDDEMFRLLYQYQHEIDSVMNEGRDFKGWFTKHLIDNVIYKQRLSDHIIMAKQQQSEPPWEKLYRSLETEFDEDYAGRNILLAKMYWWQTKKDRQAYSKVVVEYMETYGRQFESDANLNRYAWALFNYCDDKPMLTKALSWSQKAVLLNPSANWMDTYANLLYKLGHVQSAINWETTAAKLEPANKDIADNLDKMKKGLATWP